MRDGEGAASSMAGEPGGPDGLAGAYDRYADSLYKYCRSLLGDPADAADAVQDTFVIAAAAAGRPGESQRPGRPGRPDRPQRPQRPDRLRARLYAVARGECLRARRGGRTAAALPLRGDDPPHPPIPATYATSEGTGEDGEQASLRTLIEDAIGGLGPAERELIELHLWHGLEATEIATVLGLSPRRAGRLMSRADDQFQASVRVLLAGRAQARGLPGCAKLDGMLAGWDGILTPELRWWVHRHSKRCRACAARFAAELRPALLPGQSAAAAIAAAADESLRLMDGPPAELKAHTLALATGEDPSSIAYRAVLLAAAGPARRPGLPGAPLRLIAGARHGSGNGAMLTRRQLRTTAAACAMLAVVAAAVAVAMIDRATPVKLAESVQPPITRPSAPVSSFPRTSSAPAVTQRPSGPVPSRTRRAARPSAAPSPGPTAPGAGPASATPTPPPPPTPPATTARPAPPPPPPPPPPATLVVNPPGGQLQFSPFGGATFTLTAQGGPVNWSVTVSGGFGRVNIQPSSGTLKAGQSVTVFVFASRHASGMQLTITPGGTTFTIMTTGGP